MSESSSPQLNKRQFLTEIKNDILYFKIPLSRIGKYTHKKYPILKNMDKVFNPVTKPANIAGIADIHKQARIVCASPGRGKPY